MRNSNIFFIMMFLSCNHVDDKTKLSTQDFKKFEQKAEINSEAAIALYEANFAKNFQLVRDEEFLHDYKRIMYAEDNYYYIGYRSNMDKRGDKIAELHFLAKINATTGEISTVK